MRFRSAHTLTAEHVGRRVTVRRKLPEGGVGDVLGILESIDEAELVIRDRHGAEKRIARDEVVAARVIG